MLIWVLVVTFIAVLITARDWRRGLLAVLLIGVLQDIFRKLTPGVPAYYILWSTAVYVVVVMAAFRTNGIPGIPDLYLRDRSLRLAIVVFIGLIALQLVNSLVRYGNPAVVVLGALFYLGPFAAMLVGAGFADSEKRIRQFMKIYLVIFVPTCLTVYLSPILAVYFPVLRDIGTFIGRELVIYDVGTILQSNPGVMRVGEIVAWHAAACVVFLSIESIKSRSQLVRLLNAVLVILLIGAIILTGRRKMLAALTIFFALQWSMLIWYRFGMRKISVVLAILAVVAATTTLTYSPSEDAANYLERSGTVYSSIGDRAELTFRLMQSAVYRSEGVGLGAGATSQGARHAGGAAGTGAGGAAEAGLGKLIVELGFFGFLLMVAVMGIAGLKVVAQIPLVRKLSPTMLIYDVSFIAFLIANMITFAVASQLFGDLFILIVTGTIAGFVIRIHNAAVDEHARYEYSSQFK
jgi:hypothetical protein